MTLRTLCPAAPVVLETGRPAGAFPERIEIVKTKPPPKVRIARPDGRPYQLRYFDPAEQREVRISVGSRDEGEADRRKKELEARLLLGIGPNRKKRSGGANMPWEEFRERYTELQLMALRDASAIDAESRLNIAERILKPRTLADIANSEALTELQSRLLAGAESRYDPPRPRSPMTVKSHMASVMAAINWAVSMNWLPSAPKIKPIKVAKLRQMKGRPLVTEEFERMLTVTPKVVGKAAAASWKRVLRGLWESGLRIGELMAMSWDDPNQIQPVWPRRGLPILAIPHDLQKNDTEESIPMLPGFEAVLLKTPEDARTGWIFNPESLQFQLGRKPQHGRPDAEWVGKVVARIGKKANVVVLAANPNRGTVAKFASAHDLRRSCAQRLLDAGVSERDVQAVMRHASFETTRRHYAPGSVQKTAASIRETLAGAAASVPGYKSGAASS